MELEEEHRLQVLADLGILDSEPDERFDEIVELAAAICGTPISLVSLVDRKRQWFKSVLGLDVRETPREVSFCAHAIKQPDLFVVEDATADSRFANNALVTGDPGIRFYAGFPLQTGEGDALGTLCVIDRTPRKLTADQKAALEVLAKQVQARIELRKQHLELQESLRRQEKLAQDLRTSESLFRTFMHNSPFVSYIKDEDGRMLFYNRELATQFGATTEEWLGKLDHELWPQDDADVFREHDLEVLAGGRRVEYDEELRMPDGRIIHYRSIKFPYEDSDGRKMLAGVSVDVTEEMRRKEELARYQAELEAANERLRQLAVTDALTSLRNRRAFDERLAVDFSMARRRGRDLTVVMIDVDNFKKINDTLGHGAGDDVLREIAAVLETSIRMTDMAARYGGEEFAVLLPENDMVKAVQWAERFRDALRRADFEHGPVTVSMGVAGLGDARDGQELVQRADEALYAAKRGGKDAVVPYEPRFRVQRMMGR